MSEKVWTWKEVLSLGLLYDGELINLSRLYPKKIPYVLGIKGMYDTKNFKVLTGKELLGTLCLADRDIECVIKITYDHYDINTNKKEIGDYIAKHVLQVDESGILAVCSYVNVFNSKDKGYDYYCTFKIFFREDEEIIVKFENYDSDVYLEYPVRNLYKIP